MDDLKTLLDEAAQQLKAVKSQLKQRTEKLEDKAESYWEALDERIDRMADRLKEGAGHLHQQTDEARLQAHLAAMEVGQWWKGASKDLESASQTARTEIDHAKLKLHLAKLDAVQYMATDGKAFARKFSQARKEAEAEALEVMKYLKTHAGKVAQNFRREGP